MNLCFQKKYLSYIFQFSVGSVFLLSAVLKYLSIDSFDLYIYEHQLLSYNITSTLTRLLVSVEFITGLFFICNINVKTACFVAFLMLTGFTVYLIFQPFVFNLNDENCHCFGDKINFNRGQSIVKNIILIAVLLPVNYKLEQKKKWTNKLSIAIAFVAVTASMFVNPPDYIYRKIYHTSVRTDVKMYETAILNSGMSEEFSKGRQIICFYSTQCGHCKNSAVKIDEMMSFHNWNSEQIKCVFWKVDKSDSLINRFFEKNKILKLHYTTFAADTFLNIVNGKIPAILFSDKGKIIKSIDYVGINEKEIDSFLNNEQ